MTDKTANARTGSPDRAVPGRTFQIVLTPDEASANGLAIDLHGDLALILYLASGDSSSPGGRVGSLAHNEKLPTC